MFGIRSRILSLALMVFAPSMTDAPCPLGDICQQNERPASGGDGDLDRDGLPDVWEETLAERYAPVVWLDKRDWTRPASVQWLLSKLGTGGLPSTAPPAGFRMAISEREVRRGSDDERDWKTYVHVYRSFDHQRIHAQYWFFYPYNDGLWFFDHEGEWEHVTVTLTAKGEPMGVYASRHEENAPGIWRPWSDVDKLEETHARILSAKGSHASYFDESDVGWRDEVSGCDADDEDCGHVVWRTWPNGGLSHLGEKHAPRQTFVMHYSAPWGLSGSIPGMFAPRGPAHQPGWCVDGDDACQVRGPGACTMK